MNNVVGIPLTATLVSEFDYPDLDIHIGVWQTRKEWLRYIKVANVSWIDTTDRKSNKFYKPLSPFSLDYIERTALRKTAKSDTKRKELKKILKLWQNLQHTPSYTA